MPDAQTLERVLLFHLHREGALSRSDLHQRTGLHPNKIGQLVERMERAGLVRARPAEVQGRGRPKIPIEIDPTRRQVVGLALGPAHVEVARLTLRGQVLGDPIIYEGVGDETRLMEAAAEALGQAVDRSTLAVGVSVPGFLDPDQRRVLHSRAFPHHRGMSLQPIYEAAGKRMVTIESEVHALSSRWVLTHHAHAAEDVLVVSLEDGAVGASMLIEGRPNRGCVLAGNEIGHTRLAVEAPRCYCGGVGCIERIFSSEYLAQLNPGAPTLAEAAERFEPADAAAARLVELTGMGLANAVNLVRPHRLVLASRLARQDAFYQQLTGAIERQLLPELTERTVIDRWTDLSAGDAETAGWLALVRVLGQA